MSKDASDRIMRVSQAPGWQAYLLLPILYFVAAKFGGAFTTSPEGMAVIWAPNAIVLGMLLIYQGKGYWRFALLAIAAEAVGDWPYYNWWQGAIFGMVDVAEATIAYLLIRRMQIKLPLVTLNDLSRYILAGPVLATLLGGLMGGAALTLLDLAHEPYQALVRIWWFGDALGMMLVTPLMLLLVMQDEREMLPNVWFSRTPTIMMGLYTCAVLVLLAFAHAGSIYHVSVTPTLLLPPLLYVAVRYRPVFSAIATCFAAIIVAILIAKGHKPFGGLASSEELMLGQEFILMISILTLVFSALMSQIRENAYKLESRVADRTHALNQANDELSRLVKTDALTGLYNRRAFYEIALGECERSGRYPHPMVMLLLDLDHFKSINDLYGHLAGDQVLCHFAQLLNTAARSSDTIARYGGEEFVILAPETTIEEGVILAERIRILLAENPAVVLYRFIPITASIGVAALQPGESLDKLLHRADMAMYQAKSEGRNRVHKASC